VIVWLWDASGPDRCGRGVTDNKARAVQAAETYMRNWDANVAKVEAASVMLGTETLTSAYLRTGEGLRGRCGDSGIRWEPLPELAAS
jgi:hypothetical protein